MYEVNSVEILAIASNVPATKIDNLVISGFDQERLEKIVKGTGVRFRHVSSKGEMCTSDLCFAAALRIINEEGINRNDIGTVIFVSQSPDYILPATSCILHHKLGLNEDSIAFDINLGCSGYPYGLFVAASLMRVTQKKYTLLLVGETSSHFPHPQDQSSVFLFGDAGTATLLTNANSEEPMRFSFGTDGSNYNKLIVKDGGFRNPFSLKSLEPKLGTDGNIRSDVNLYMDGMEIFNFSMSKVVRHIKSFIDPIDSYQGFVFHQANLLMLESMRKMVKIPKEKFLLSLHEYGNTSSASIPLTLCHNYSSQYINGKYFMAGFGVGLSWASASISMNNVHIYGVEEGIGVEKQAD